MNLQPKKGWDEIMSEWKKVKIGDVFILEKGSLQSSKCIQGKYPFITAAKYWKTNNTYTHDCEAIVYAVAASGSLGRTHYVNGKFIASDLCFILTEKNKTKYPINFLFYQILFELLRDDIVFKTKTGTSKESISQKNLYSYEIPYFSIDFQNTNSKRLINTKNIITKLNKEIELQKAYIKCLSQNILQKAIEGKLTEKWRLEHPLQKGNPDYDAQALFALIQKEKKPDKKKQVLLPIKETEKAFEIPNNWKWVRLGEIFEHKTGKTLNSSNNKGTIKKKYITTSNLYWDYFDFAKMKEMNFTENEIEKYLVKKGDLLVCEGGDVGRSAIWNYDYSVCYQNHIHRLRSFSSVNMKFYYFILYLYKISGYINSQSKGMGIQSLSANRLGSFVIPLPPLSEQKEIVKIVDTSLSKITELEKEISIREEYINKLEKSIFKNVFEE